MVNYFDSQRFGSLKHGQGFIVKDLMRGEFEAALRNVLARPSELDRSGDAKVKAFWHEHWGEWDRQNPHPGADRYAAVVRHLRSHPAGLPRRPPPHRAALARAAGLRLPELAVERGREGLPARRWWASPRLTSIRYQAGTLLFPRELDAAPGRACSSGRTFPLLAPATRFDGPVVEQAALSVLGREDMTLADLRGARHARDPLRRRRSGPCWSTRAGWPWARPRQDELNRVASA